jgi:integrase
MPALKAKIGLRQIADLESNSIIWDTTIPGFNVRRQFSEVITYSIIYRNREGAQKWYKLGRHPILTPHLARQEAVKILRAVTLGEDPSGERKALRNAMTVAQLADQYIADLESGRINGKKLSTLASDKSRVKNHIVPKIGKLKAVSVTQEQAEDFMHDLSIGNARRTIGLLGAIFSWAVKRKIRADNPCHGIEKPKDNKRTRRLSNAEYVQLNAAISKADNPFANVFMMLAITGWRSGEVKNLRWAELDLERRVATLGATKTGLSIRPLCSAAIDLIQQQPRTSEFVFAEARGKIRHYWLQLGMSRDVTPHTLRHSFASLAADMGLPDNTIAGLLGHARSSITSRYIHLDKALIAAADLVAGETMRLMRA